MRKPDLEDRYTPVTSRPGCDPWSERAVVRNARKDQITGVSKHLSNRGQAAYFDPRYQAFRLGRWIGGISHTRDLHPCCLWEIHATVRGFRLENLSGVARTRGWLNEFPFDEFENLVN